MRMMRGEVKMERIERYGISHLLFVVVDLPIAQWILGQRRTGTPDQEDEVKGTRRETGHNTTSARKWHLHDLLLSMQNVQLGGSMCSFWKDCHLQ
jgi:hypothetical protein